MKKLLLLSLLLLVSMGGAFAQNNARMLGPPNAQTGTSYTFIAADTTRVVTFNNAAAVAVTLPNGATSGFGAGTMLSVVNLGAGTVTITCTSCTINGAATLVLSQNQGADLYGGSGSPAVNYISVASPAGASLVTLGGNNPFTGNNTHSGTETFANINGAILCDGSKYTSLNAAAAAVPNPGTLIVTSSCPAQNANLGIPATTTLWVFGQAQLNRNGFNLSINGPVMAGPSQIITGSGTTSFCDTNVGATCSISAIYANWFPGADIDAQTNNALVAATSGGLTFPEVKIANPGPNGYTAVTTTISVPFKNNSGLKLTLESGTVINFTGTGNADWLDYFATSAANNNRFTLDMRGAKVIGNVAAGSCIHYRQIVGGSIYEPYCTLFTNGTNFLFGDGILFEGSLDINVYTPMLIGNNMGAWLIPSNNAAGTTSGSNTNTFVGGRIQSNAAGGVIESQGPVPGTAVNTKNLYGYAGDIEGNGTSNPITVGSLTAALSSNVVTITGAGTNNGITAGMYAVQSGFTGGTVALSCLNTGSSTQGGLVITAATATTYSYGCVSANGSGTGSGSVTAYGYQGLIEDSQNTTFSNIFSQWGTSTGMLAEYIVGSSVGIGGPQPTGIEFNSLFCTSNSQSAECIFAQNSKNIIFDGNTREFGANTSFQCGNGAFTGITLSLTPTPTGGGAVTSGCSLASISANTANQGINIFGTNNLFPEGSAPSAAANAESCYGDSTAHALKCSYNNGSFFVSPQTIANGTKALNTASITTATCDAGVAATATGTLSTDTVDWSFNAAPSATNKYGAFLVVYAVPSANTVTFYTCNPSATTSTPTAMTVNWSVRRP